MLDAVVEDMERIPGVQVETVVHAVGADDDDMLAQLAHAAGRADWSLIIAPELDGHLLRLCSVVAQAGGKLLGPTNDAIRLTSDKLALATHWRAHAVPTPATSAREPSPCEAFPVVWKPRDGAGSASTYLFRDAWALAKGRAELQRDDPGREMLLQEYIPGVAASVAFLCGPRGYFRLLPASQEFEDDRGFRYKGGRLPLEPPLADRAVSLARRAVDCVAGLRGYVGVDLVLGDAEDGSRDHAIEINPRLTTSYVGLRTLAEFDLAAAMLDIAGGEAPPPFRWAAGTVSFRSDGLLLR